MELLFENEEAFEKAFEQCTIPPSEFTHEAHLFLSWIHIRKYGIKKAIINLTTQLKKYTAFVGAEKKYNETLTVSAAYTVYHFMKRSPSSTFAELLNEFPRLKNNLKDLLSQYYGFDIYHAAEAKQKYLLPDLLPFDQTEDLKF